MALDLQGCGRGKIVVQLGASLYGTQLNDGNAAFGSVVKTWWACEVVDIEDNICFISTNGLRLSDGDNTFFVIDESDYLFTETALP